MSRTSLNTKVHLKRIGCYENCFWAKILPNFRFPIPSSPANGKKNLDRLYIRVVGSLVVCNAGGLGMSKYSNLSLGTGKQSNILGHIWNPSWTKLGQIWDISWTYLGLISDISGTYLGLIWNVSRIFLDLLWDISGTYLGYMGSIWVLSGTYLQHS